MQQDQIIEIFKRAAWEIDRKKIENVDLDQKISDLGIDSVAMLEVIGFLEEEIGVNLPDEKIARVVTLRDLTNVIQEG